MTRRRGDLSKAQRRWLQLHDGPHYPVRWWHGPIVKDRNARELNASNENGITATITRTEHDELLQRRLMALGHRITPAGRAALENAR